MVLPSVKAEITVPIPIPSILFNMVSMRTAEKQRQTTSRVIFTFVNVTPVNLLNSLENRSVGMMGNRHRFNNATAKAMERYPLT